MNDPLNNERMIELRLRRIVIRDEVETQAIYLTERGGERGFPIVIGSTEAMEIRRVVTNEDPRRPLTHQLTTSIVEALSSRIIGVEIVDLRENTFYANILLEQPGSEEPIRVDARPSDALAIGMRVGCPIRVTEPVLEMARTDTSGPDRLPE